MNILILGSGGREHAIADRLARDSGNQNIAVMPGNPGMKITSGLNILGGEVSLQRVIDFAISEAIDLVVIGPEKFLFEGYVDALHARGIRAFGPTQAASFLESSKIESKRFMMRHQIPTSDFVVIPSESEGLKAVEANAHWKGFVIKLSGPALGKGVIVTDDASSAKNAIGQFFLHQPPGFKEGVLMEEKISGREVSLFYICSGDDFQFLASACDHKRLLDQDQGPNTGGMGAYSPCHWIDDSFLEKVEGQIVRPTLVGMMNEQKPFSGILFLGLMVDGDRISLLEYNTRFGDPETQTFLPILPGNFTAVLKASADGNLNACATREAVAKPRHALHVVKAARGYPGLFGDAVETGQKVELESSLASWTDARLFYAGVKESGSDLLTQGGRVLGVTGIGETLEAARAQAYLHLQQIHFSGQQFRSDIGSEA